MKRIGAMSFGLLLAAAAAAQAPASLDGDWDGGLKVPAGIEVPIVLHIHGDSATMESPDQGASGVPATVARDGEKVTVTIPSAKGMFTGALSADGKAMAGAFAQGSMSLPASFAHRAPGAPPPAPDRPQTPKPPFPYEVREVTLPGAGGIMLAGTLTRPPGAAPVPAVVMVAGSGPQNRDETVAGHKPFLVLADALTRAGIAVLRYDKRGVGGSGGHYAEATARELAGDVAAAVTWLRLQPGIDPAHVGLIGHSEGAEIAPEVARADPQVAFLVLLSAPGVRGDQVMLSQKEAVERAMGVPEAKIAEGRATEQLILATVLDTPDAAQLKPKLVAALGARGVQPEAAQELAEEAASPAFRMLLNHDPAPALRALKQPVLVIAGDRDLQVAPSLNLPPIRAALAANGRAEIVELPGLNHLLQPAIAGAPQDYGRIATTIDSKVLGIVTEWVVKTAR